MTNWYESAADAEKAEAVFHKQENKTLRRENTALREVAEEAGEILRYLDRNGIILANDLRLQRIRVLLAGRAASARESGDG